MKVYQDPLGGLYSMLVVNKAGRVRRIYTPFRVICIQPVAGIKAQTQVYVDAVLGTQKGEIYFLIFQQPYLHTHFHIILHF